MATILLPVFKRHSYSLAFTYFAFCILNLVAIAIDNISVLSLLKLSQEYMENGTNNVNSFELLGTMLKQKHWWTHYLSLLISCFSAFVLYYILFISRLVPRAIAAFGIVAVVLMFIEILFSIFGHSISMNMLLPIGLIQVLLSFWLIYKGLNSSLENDKSKNNLTLENGL